MWELYCVIEGFSNVSIAHFFHKWDTFQAIHFYIICNIQRCKNITNSFAARPTSSCLQLSSSDNIFAFRKKQRSHIGYILARIGRLPLISSLLHPGWSVWCSSHLCVGFIKPVLLNTSIWTESYSEIKAEALWGLQLLVFCQVCPQVKLLKSSKCFGFDFYPNGRSLSCTIPCANLPRVCYGWAGGWGSDGSL